MNHRLWSVCLLPLLLAACDSSTEPKSAPMKVDAAVSYRRELDPDLSNPNRETFGKMDLTIRNTGEATIDLVDAAVVLKKGNTIVDEGWAAVTVPFRPGESVTEEVLFQRYSRDLDGADYGCVEIEVQMSTSGGRHERQTLRHGSC